MIILIAQIQIKPGQSDAFLNAVKAAIAPSRAEEPVVCSIPSTAKPMH